MCGCGDVVTCCTSIIHAASKQAGTSNVADPISLVALLPEVSGFVY